MGVSTSMKPRASSCRRSDEIMRARVTNTLRDSGIRDQIQIALAVARLHVFEAVPFFGHGEQGFGKERPASPHGR
jgi:hypothetical protein